MINEDEPERNWRGKDARGAKALTEGLINAVRVSGADYAAETNKSKRKRHNSTSPPQSCIPSRPTHRLPATVPFSYLLLSDLHYYN
jgi:hypothetical protein